MFSKLLLNKPSININLHKFVFVDIFRQKKKIFNRNFPNLNINNSMFIAITYNLRTKLYEIKNIRLLYLKAINSYFGFRFVKLFPNLQTKYVCL